MYEKYNVTKSIMLGELRIEKTDSERGMSSSDAIPAEDMLMWNFINYMYLKNDERIIFRDLSMAAFRPASIADSKAIEKIFDSEKETISKSYSQPDKVGLQLIPEKLEDDVRILLARPDKKEEQLIASKRFRRDFTNYAINAVLMNFSEESGITKIVASDLPEFNAVYFTHDLNLMARMTKVIPLKSDSMEKLNRMLEGSNI